MHQLKAKKTGTRIVLTGYRIRNPLLNKDAKVSRPNLFESSRHLAPIIYANNRNKIYIVTLNLDASSSNITPLFELLF